MCRNPIDWLPVAIIDKIVWKAFWKSKKSYWQEISKSCSYWPALPSNKRKMRCTKWAGATSPCWLLSADRELEAWIGFATFRRNWHGLVSAWISCQIQTKRSPPKKVTQLFEDGVRRASLKFCLKISYDSTNMYYMLTAYKSLELQNLDKVG